VVRTPVDIPFKARKVRVYPTKCEAEDVINNNAFNATLNTQICFMRFEVFVQPVPTDFEALMKKPKIYQEITNGLPYP
jgi:hypothetical protein